MAGVPLYLSILIGDVGCARFAAPGLLTAPNGTTDEGASHTTVRGRVGDRVAREYRYEARQQREATQHSSACKLLADAILTKVNTTVSGRQETIVHVKSRHRSPAKISSF